MEFPHPSIPSSGCLSQSSHCLGQWFTRFSSWFTFKLSTIVENTQASPYQSSLYQKLKLRLLKILINSFEHKINPLKHNIDSIYLFKITAFSKTKKCNEKEHFFFLHICKSFSCFVEQMTSEFSYPLLHSICCRMFLLVKDCEGAPASH